MHSYSGWQDGTDWSPAHTAAVIPSKRTANTGYAFRDTFATTVQRHSTTRLEQYFTTPTYHSQGGSAASGCLASARLPESQSGRSVKSLQSSTGHPTT